MTRPTKKWVVGERVFEDYSAACAHVRTLKDHSMRDEFVAFLVEEIDLGEGYTGDDTEKIADKILARWILKPRP